MHNLLDSNYWPHWCSGMRQRLATGWAGAERSTLYSATKLAADLNTFLDSCTVLNITLITYLSHHIQASIAVTLLCSVDKKNTIETYLLQLLGMWKKLLLKKLSFCWCSLAGIFPDSICLVCMIKWWNIILQYFVIWTIE